MSERGYPASEMGPKLLEHVEQELLDDLRYHGVATEGASFDWSDPVQEGHVTHYLDGMLEEMSDVLVFDARGLATARGWIDFVHAEADGPLYVFWIYLEVREGDRWRYVKGDPGLPAHVWSRLPERSKELCAAEARWREDPLVMKWRQARRGQR